MLRITYFFQPQNALRWSGGTWLKEIFPRGYITQKRLRTIALEGYVIFKIYIFKMSIY